MKMKTDLENIYEWFKLNKLRVNLVNFKCMIISKNPVLNVSQVIIILGVIIDENLKVQEHLKADKRKIYLKIYRLARIRKNLN